MPREVLTSGHRFSVALSSIDLPDSYSLDVTINWTNVFNRFGENPVATYLRSQA